MSTGNPQNNTHYNNVPSAIIKPSPVVSQPKSILPGNKIKFLFFLRTFFLLLMVFSLAGSASLIYLRINDENFLRSKIEEPQIYFSETWENHFTDPNGWFEINFDQDYWEPVDGRDSFNLLAADKNTQRYINIQSFDLKDYGDLATFINQVIKKDAEILQNNSLNNFEQKQEKFGDFVYEVVTYPSNNLSGENLLNDYLLVSDTKILRLTVPVQELDQQVFDILSSIKLLTTTGNKVKGEKTASVEEKVINRYKPATVRLYVNHCAEFKENESGQIFYMDKQPYNFCIGGLGSGFMVNNQGYVATNGHVVSMDPRMILYYAIMQAKPKEMIEDYMKEIMMNSFKSEGLLAQHPEDGMVIIISDKEYIPEKNIDSFLQAIIDKNYEKFVSSPSNLADMADEVLTHIEKGYGEAKNKDGNEIYVQYGTNYFNIDDEGGLSNKNDMLKGALTAIDFDPQTEYEGNPGEQNSDVAIVKLNKQSDYPTVVLGSIEELSPGDSLVVMGYPASGTDLDILDVSSGSQLTATRGIISALKKGVGGQRNLIQTDAAISSGNSGGPGFDNNGKVVGIATYGVLKEDFNYLIDIEDLEKLMTKNNIENSQGNIDLFWKEGLSYYDQSKYQKALKKFEEVQSLDPNNISVAGFIESSNKKIKNGEDRSSFWYDPFIRYVIIAGGASFIISGILMVVISIIIKHKKKILQSINPAQTVVSA